MITNKEMFCVIFGAVASNRMSFKDTKLILSQARVEFGLTKNEADSILKEMDSTLVFVIKRLRDKALSNKDNGFDV